MTTGKTIALTMWSFVDRIMSLLFNTLSTFVIAFLLRSNCLLILQLQSPSTVTLQPKKRKSVTQSFQFSHSVMSNSATPWTAALQASLSITSTQSLLRLMSIKLVTPSNHLILNLSLLPLFPLYLL